MEGGKSPLLIKSSKSWSSAVVGGAVSKHIAAVYSPQRGTEERRVRNPSF